MTQVGFVVTSDHLNAVLASLDPFHLAEDHRLYVLLSALIGLSKQMDVDRSELIDALRKNWKTIPAPEVVQP